MGDLKSSIIIELINRVSGPANKIRQSLLKIGLTQEQLNAVGKAAGRVGQDMGRVKREAGSLMTKMGILGGAGLWFVKSQLVDTAAQFEKFRTVLETVEGSSAKAKSSMDWVSDFATKTPYELDEVMESFVRLRAYGLDPTNGLLRALGDTASAMGKPIMQAVEAIADAITGENERLKEFGIRAEVKGNALRYAYTDQAGKQQYKSVDKNNRKLIESTLMAIWNEKYAGAMDKQSRTWAGMVSNLSDQWTRFTIKIMDAGLFDWLKNKIGGLLTTLDQMAANGSLQKLANDIGGKLKEGFVAAWRAGEALLIILSTLGRIISWLAGIMGGYENLAKAVALLMAGKFLLSVGMLAMSFLSLGKAAIPAAAAALKGLIPLLSQASVTGGGLMALLGKAGLVAGAGAFGYAVGTLLNQGIGKVMEMSTGGKYKGKGAVGDWLYDLLHPEKKQPTEARSFSQPQQSKIGPPATERSGNQSMAPDRLDLAKQRSTTKTDVGGTIKIEIKGAPARVKEMRTNNRDVDFDVYSGLTMVGP